MEKKKCECRGLKHLIDRVTLLERKVLNQRKEFATLTVQGEDVCKYCGRPWSVNIQEVQICASQNHTHFVEVVQCCKKAIEEAKNEKI